MTLTFPVLLWPDVSGAWTAVLVGDFEPTAASAPTETEALRQLKELLEWRLVNEPWNADADLLEPALVEVKVEVRPQYTAQRRLIPCPDTVWLRVPCVTGRQSGGLRLCVVPPWSIQFNFQESADLAGLVAHFAKDKLQRLSPAELAACLPPRGCRLEEIVLRDAGERERRRPPLDRPELKPLFAVADPLLHAVGRPRTTSAAYGRETLAEALAGKLGRGPTHLLLVGESGVGKSTLLAEAAKRLARQGAAADGPEDEAEDRRDLRTYRFWRGGGGRLIAGMRFLGEWEERCEEFVEHLHALDGLFCVENLLELIQVGGQGPGDSVAAFFLPYLQRGELRMVAEATPEEVEACRRLLPGLLDEFQVFHVPAFDEPTALQVLNRVASAHASAARLVFDPGAVTLVYRLFRRFRPYSAFPGPAAGFVRSLCEKQQAPANPRNTVSADDVIQLFVQQTGLPELFLRDEQRLELEEVRAHLAGQVIGQPEPTQVAAGLIASIKTGLTDPNRPLGVLLFCGPSGVGKTALAKALVDYCFGAGARKDRLVRLDMSEYAGWGAASRLLQNPQGGPADWIERVRRQPFCVLLLDEIEKAAPEVFDALLGLLDEGRLTDRFGRVTWFRSAVVIMTSNLGAQAAPGAGFGPETGPSYEVEAGRFFRPEFFNRLDAVLTFQPLGREQIEAITRKELVDLAAREGLAAAGIRVRWTDRLVAAVAREGYDRRLGARPLQRTIETMVVVPLARWRAGQARVREVSLRVDLDDHGCTIVQQEPPEPARPPRNGT